MSSGDSFDFRNSARITLLVVAGIWANAGTATADTWHVGDFITHDQGEWGNAPDPGTAAALLLAEFNTVYAATGGSLEVGLPGASGYSILFTDPEYILGVLPTAGYQVPLNGDYVNPTVGIPTIVAGDVVALQLDIGYSDAGLLAGASDLRFGDLILTNFTVWISYDGSIASVADLNGLTVRQFLGDVNVALGGGASIDPISALDDITVRLVESFVDGQIVTQFAQDHLIAPNTPVSSAPEPASWVLLGTGLLGIAAARRRQRSHQERAAPRREIRLDG